MAAYDESVLWPKCLISESCYCFSWVAVGFSGSPYLPLSSPGDIQGEIHDLKYSVGLFDLNLKCGITQVHQSRLQPTKRKAATEPLSSSVVEKQPGQMDPHVNKRPTPLQPMANKFGSQRVQTPKNKTAILEASPKAQSGSFEAVRSKMRETLAAALSVGIQDQEKPSNELNNSPSEAVKFNVDFQPDGSTATVGKFEEGGSKEGQDGKHDGQEPQYNYVMPEADGSFGDTFFVKDELLQGNGLSWAWDMGETESKEVNGAEQGRSGDINGSKNDVKSPEELASIIEAELFKLFGGVNKKYKEKGRSLMFNLKDRSNPELREKVLSGVISPERLCSMTPEELASKQLSEWRMAKAEEHDKMIVLQESDVDIRRLVKKTHKGEYQVEVEQDDAVSVEVSLGSTSFTQFQPKKKKTGHEVKEKEVTEADKSSSENLTIPADGTDFMQELIVDEFKDEGFLPPIVSLDEFMESLNSEPPFENLPVDSKETKQLNPETVIETGEKKATSEPASAGRVDQPKAKSNEAILSMKASDTSVERKPISASSAVIGEYVWEGELQLTISSSVSAIGLFRSGEKTSTKEWPGSMEIKGRVRLDAFEKFLQELPMSRTRAVMVVHFVLKDPSSEPHLAMLSEAVDSYIADERLGFGEPIPGVELYFCPPHTRIIEMLCKHLSKNQTDILKSTDNGLIGVVPNNNDDDDDDIPPGFGPGAAAAAARDEDDLPEFSFSGNPSGQKIPAQVGFQSNLGRPVDQMRQLIYRYGQNANVKDGATNKQPRNKDDEDDDMPEWQPHQHQNHIPEVPPGHYMQQPSGPHMVNQLRQPVGQVMGPQMTMQPHVNMLQNVVRWAPPAGPHMLPPGAPPPGQYYDGQWRLDAPRSRGF
ncbi:hypothetical protein SSX86_006012 [Deinandra increscens subsp. villosa]|uniref:TFIIS central domain-containing protein n=1 Tax=Deinandra increscens subsp. villosa TaxID=3103831 RepID=A0AAP0DQY4_9ASTR